MATNLSAYEKDLERLVKLGERLLLTFADEEMLEQLKRPLDEGFTFAGEYQNWYSESHRVVAQLIPDRIADFEAYYKQEKRKDISYATYTLADYLLDMRIVRAGRSVFDANHAASAKYAQQFLILKSASQRFRSSLFDIKQLVQADLFDSEIQAAKELAKHGFFRAAGALGGVVLEKHLGQVCSDHKIKIGKTNPTISDLNDSLKNASIIDTPVWRSIQRLGDLRNLCSHNKQREPTKDEVIELLDGIDQKIKTVF